MRRKWVGLNVTVLGLSLSGTAAAKYLSDKGAEVIISESRTAAENDFRIISDLEEVGIKVEMGSNNEETILNSDIIVTSPGIPPHSEVIKLIKNHKIPLISEIELAFRESEKPFIAITGTNGKTTATKLISEILADAGYKAPACGNIGVPPISLVDDEPDYFVTEVSSFQIYYSPSFKPQIGVFLNYTPDHKDWHGSEDEYFKAKADLFTGIRTPVWSVLNACDAKVSDLRHEINSEVVFFGREMPKASVYIQNDRIMCKLRNTITEVMPVSEIHLIGKHNLQNVMAAVAVCSIVGVNNETMKNTISAFKPPEHRIEYVDTIDGISYYNDSKATNPDSTICALNGFSDNKAVLIAGGRDKGTDLSEMAEAVKNNTMAVILIGEASDRFENALRKVGYSSIYRANSLEEAIDMGGNMKLGPVLLSPACASYDMFKNYEQRGNIFKDYVHKKKTIKYDEEAKV